MAQSSVTIKPTTKLIPRAIMKGVTGEPRPVFGTHAIHALARTGWTVETLECREVDLPLFKTLIEPKTERQEAA